MTIELILNDRVVDMVEEGFDLALRIATLKDSSLAARRLAPCRLVVAAAPAYLDRRGRPASPDELADHDCLLYTYASQRDVWQFEHDGRVCAVKVSGPLRSNNGEALTRAAIDGMGVILQPTFVVSTALQRRQLEIILPGWMLAPLGIYAVWPASRHLPAKVRTFVDFLVEQFKKEPYWDRDIPPRSPT